MTSDYFGDWAELGTVALAMNQWLTFPSATQTDKSLFRLTFSTNDFNKAIGFWSWVRVARNLNNKELSKKIWVRDEPIQVEFPIFEDLKVKGITIRNFQAMLDYPHRLSATVPAISLKIEEFLG